MKYRTSFLFVLTVILIVAIGWYAYTAFVTDLSAPAPAEAAAGAARQPTVQTVNGETVVFVSPAAQRASHIEVSALGVTNTASTRSAYATVIDLQPFFDLRNRLATARSDVDTLTAQAANSRAQFTRSQALFADDQNVSRKSLQDAEAAMQADEARLRSARTTQGGLDAMLRQQYGDTLAGAATAASSDLFARLQTGRAAVLRVTLPAAEGGKTHAPPQGITNHAPNGEAVDAQRLSISPTADPAIQGESWLYVSARALPSGLRTDAHLPVAQQSTASLIIPAPAVLWYGGQTWVYVKTAPTRFTRRFVPASSADDRGIAVTTGFHAGDEVVTQGAQLLLSEELKPQGIATACKDPPECDD
jgi:hypothetical protein